MVKITQEEWSQHAPSYSMDNGLPMTMPLIRESFINSFYRLVEHQISDRAPKPVRILILAGGVGAEAIVLRQKFSGEQVQIVSTDGAPGMVDVMHEAFQIHGIDDVKVEVADAENLVYPDASFDGVFLLLGPMLIDDIDACFAHIHRVLSTGGFAAFMTPSGMEVHEVFMESRKRVLQKSGRNQGQTPSTHNSTTKTPADQDIKQTIKNWGDHHTLKDEIERGSFSNVSSTALIAHLPLPKAKDAESLLNTLYDNPGMKKGFNGDLNEKEIEDWKNTNKLILDEKRTKFNDSSKFGVELKGSIAWGFKTKA